MLALLLGFHHELQHFELVLLHGSHVLHLLMVYSFVLIDHAGVATLRMGL